MNPSAINDPAESRACLQAGYQRPNSSNLMIWSATIALASAAIFAVGCSKREDPAYTPPANTASNPESQLTETLSQLTAVARDYQKKHGVLPPTFREFALAAKIRIPMEPSGKMFSLDTNTGEVSLVKRQ